MMTEFGSSALAGYLIISGILFVVGMIGFFVRRNLIVMFLCTELMFQVATERVGEVMRADLGTGRAGGKFHRFATRECHLGRIG